MKKLRLYLQKHPNILRVYLLGYIIFAGCVVFPFGNERFPFDFMKGYLVISSYGIIGLGLERTYGKHKEKFVYITTLCLTGLGMISRYILEYGEVSNTMNFTPFNIISYLAITPILTTGVYYFFVEYYMKKS